MEALLGILDFTLFKISDSNITVAKLLQVPLIFLVAYFLFNWSSKRLTNKLKKSNLNPNVVLLVNRVYVILAIIVLVITLLDLLNVPLTAFAFISGAIAIGVGFGAQNIINNFISGWILMWERPIRIGDFLEIGDVKGTVETINTRSTRIRRVDGVHLLIPNSQLLENTVVNWTLIDKLARATVRVGVAYGSPTRKVQELITEIANKHDDILKEPAPLVVFEDFGDNALIFDLYFWINAFGEKDLRVIKSEIRFRIDEAFAAEDIVIAFPQRDVHLDGQLKIVSNEIPGNPS